MKRENSALRIAAMACLALNLTSAGASAQDAEAPVADRSGATAEVMGAVNVPSPVELRMQAYSLFPGSAADKTKAIDLFKQAAEAGDAESMAFLGSIYLSGDGVTADRAEAVNWYVRAAQAGHVGAVTKLAELAAAPSGGTSDAASASGPAVTAPAADAPETAVASEEAAAMREEARGLIEDGQLADGFELMQQAAEAGDVRAMGEMGQLYLGGVGTTRSKSNAKAWLEKAAQGGDVLAMVNLADLLEAGGVGVTVDQAAADEYRREARVAIERMNFVTDAPVLLEIAQSMAQNASGDLSEYGTGLLRRLARGGSTEAMIQLGELAVTYEDALGWYEQAAEAGDVFAMRQAGEYYLDGLGTQIDFDAAVKWLQRAADAGDELAAEQLAEATELAAGSDIEDRVQEAIDLYIGDSMTPAQEASVRATFEEGVEANHLESKYWLADMLSAGTWSDAERGFALMNEYVAEGGDEFGMAAIARAYEIGVGTSKDLALSLEWFKRAVSNGYQGQADIERVSNRLAATPPLPTATQPPGDRWGPFRLDGGYATGVRSGGAYFAFGCLDDGVPYLEYKPSDALHSNVAGMSEVWVVLKTSREEYAVKVATGNNALYSFSEATLDWMQAAARANSVELVVTGDLNNWNYRPYNRASFTARGSSAAISDLRDTCKTVAQLAK